ncbi:uncharacterized protein C11orf91 homolog [Rhinoderma darwinii]|uniref:uncharacterized protein C11orf91 homolog n=1 Tax=Rhinoderma darwinii TaxID=43563 RepID=UPI003F6736A7
MATPMPVYFPSLYDKSLLDSPESHFNIWKKLGITFTDNSNGHRGEVSRWPPGLADLSYNPIWFFSTHIKEDLRPQTSLPDKLCELGIQIKEIELLIITGDWFDVQKYHYLRAVKEKMFRDIKAMQDHGKLAQASLKRELFSF